MAATTTPEENKRLARRFPEEIATEGKVDLIDEICAEEVTDHNPLGEMHGRDELKDHLTSLRAAFGGFSAAVEEAIAEGEIVAMRVTLRGNHEGEFLGIAPTGTEVEVANMVFTRVEDGQIVERWVQPDMLGLMQQLGVIDVPGE
ncbi:ester cyclase [Natrinema sp. 1APR25-10V2]|uniref:ester cyclase n=1 Tax=Natrinema sp. 1APR25-10V2 TaxID=2951081 RepID=UPI0031F3198F